MMMVQHPHMSGGDNTAARGAKHQIQICGHTYITLSSRIRKPTAEKNPKDAFQNQSAALALSHQTAASVVGQVQG